MRGESSGRSPGPGSYGPFVNGDEVRDTRFLRPSGNRTRGYDVAEVDEFLGRIAAELDAGRRVGSLIENAVFGTGMRTRAYDVGAVDWFLEQLRCREDHRELAGVSDPWRDLAVANYFTDGGRDDLADRTVGPVRRARRKDRARDRECLARECADAWRDFGQQPGTQLRWADLTGRHLFSAVHGELQTAQQQPVVTARLRRTTGWPTTASTGARTFTGKRVTGSAWPGVAEIVRRSDPDYGAGRSLDAGTPGSREPRAKASSVKAFRAVRARLHPIRELLDETGTPILYACGNNFDGWAGACITFPDQRRLNFPVRGTEPGNAIMTAVDQAGSKVARYQWKPEEVGITVHPGQQLTDELVLALVVSAGWLWSYFTSPASGG